MLKRSLLFALLALLTLAAAPVALAQPATECPPGQAPHYVFGFAALHEALGDRMGEPTTCEFPDPNGTGDVHQRTSQGLAFWRKSTNTPTFTNGWEHWAITDQGLVYWTGESIDPTPDALPVAPPAAAPAPEPTPAPTPPPATGTVTVDIRGFSYEPRTLTVAVGTTVVWVNHDQVAHTVTADDRSFDSGLFGEGMSWSYTFTEPGTYGYYCIPHGAPGVGMYGTVIVTGS